MQSNKISIVYTSTISISKAMEIALRISDSYGFVDKVEVLFNRYGKSPGSDQRHVMQYANTETDTGYSLFKSELKMDSLGYRTFVIEITINHKVYWIVEDEETGEAKLVTANAHGYKFWECFTYKATNTDLRRVKGGIMYHIFVDTFCAEDIPDGVKDSLVEWSTFPKWKPDSDGEYRNNQFYGGNLRGIIKQLPHIKSLGTTVIYLSPVFKSPSSNGYDISNYEEISERIGTWEDLDELHRKANKLNMDLVLDVVFNHSSSENPLTNEEPEIYGFEERYWWGFKGLREFDTTSQKYFTYLRKWLMLYARYSDGLRLDVADNLPDYVLKFIREVYPGYILLEVWKDAVVGDHRDFLTGEEGDGVMNYRFGNAIYKAVRWKDFNGYFSIVKNVMKLYPPQAIDCSPIFLDSHDTPRMPNILTNELMKPYGTENVWDIDKDPMWMRNDIFDTYFFRQWSMEHDKVPEDQKEKMRALRRLAIFLQYTLPGLPSIFAGDEAGVEGLKDPFNRKPFPWDNIDDELLKFYIKIGTFRTSHTDTFADSTNFKPQSSERMQGIFYKRDDLKFIANISEDYMILPEKLDLRRAIYTIDPKGLHGRKGDVINPYEAVVFE